MIKEILITGLKDTVYMVSYATLFAVILGFIFAIILILTDNNGLNPISLFIVCLI